MTAKVIEGKRIGQEIREEVRLEVARLRERGVVPGLAAVLVGNHPASRVYVRNKVKACQSLGVYSQLVALPEETTTAPASSMCLRSEPTGCDPRHPGPVAAAGSRRRESRPAGHRPGQGCGWPAPHECRGAWLWAGRACGPAPRAGLWRSFTEKGFPLQGASSRSDRAQQSGGETVGPALVATARHRHLLPLQNPGPDSRRQNRRHSGGCGGATGHGDGGLRQARRRGHRCRNQPGRGSQAGKTPLRTTRL